MTRFKQYARSKGIKLYDDYEEMPTRDGLEDVLVLPERAAVLEYYVFYGWTATYIRRDGTTYTADPSREEIAAALNRGNAWWDQVDPDEVSA